MMADFAWHFFPSALFVRPSLKKTLQLIVNTRDEDQTLSQTFIDF